jgi:hypothetical protein
MVLFAFTCVGMSTFPSSHLCILRPHYACVRAYVLQASGDKSFQPPQEIGLKCRFRVVAKAGMFRSQCSM